MTIHHPGTGTAIQIAHDIREVIYPTREVIYPTREVIYPAREVIYPAREVIYPAREVIYPAREGIYPTREIIYPVREEIYPTRATTDLEAIERLIGTSNDVNNDHAHHRVTIDVNASRLRPLHVLTTDASPFLNVLGHNLSLLSAQHHQSHQYLSLAITRICFRKGTRP